MMAGLEGRRLALLGGFAGTLFGCWSSPSDSKRAVLRAMFRSRLASYGFMLRIDQNASASNHTEGNLHGEALARPPRQPPVVGLCVG